MVKKRLKIIWDDEAKQSLRSIYNYIRSHESLEVAKKVRNKIALVPNPLMISLKSLKRSKSFKMNRGITGIK